MDLSDHVRNTEAAARAGDAQAQHEFAAMLRVGELVARNLEESRAWYAKAAMQGNPVAQNDFASMLLNGMGGDKDGESAALWYLRAAEGGCAAAQFTMAQRYLHGDYVEVDHEQVAFWGAKAADNGYVPGATLLGNCYRFGRGVDADLLHAARLYVRGARGSDPVAHGNLADCREAVEALALAGGGIAALITATVYAEGLGGETDRPLAKAWLDLLGEMGASDLNTDDQEASHALYKSLEDALEADGLRRAEQDLQRLRSRVGETRSSTE
jgi:TPR repeat protein